MNNEHLTAQLAERIFGWRPTPTRFLIGEGGSWTPRWKFQPAKRLADALRLLQAASAEYEIRSDAGGNFLVRVKIGVSIGEARRGSQPEAIVVAIALALGIAVEVSQ